MTIKECRMALGWTIMEACQKLGISFPTYKTYEDGPKEHTTKGEQLLKRLQGYLEKKAEPYVIDSSTDDFAALREKHAYYVDKSMLIKDLLSSNETLLLFARPRRFGKSLTLSMLGHFFSLKSDPKLFEGLKIEEESALCAVHQNQYPVIRFSFKDVEGASYAEFLSLLSIAVAEACSPWSELLDSPALRKEEKDELRLLFAKKADSSSLRNAILLLTRLLYAYYHKRVIVLIDEYDVPLQKASTLSYCDEALMLISGLLSAGLKGNPYLAKGILTGCLCISKETMFTGLNNVVPYTMLDPGYSGYFGFNEEEVRTLLSYYHLEDKLEEVRDYYDGYHNGYAELYCPFDIMRYVADHIIDPIFPPQFYWMNTSENEIVYRLADKASYQTKQEIEDLLLGKEVLKEVSMKMTYRSLEEDSDNLWSVLLTSGYLSFEGYQGSYARLRIPNKEVHRIFQKQILKYVDEKAHKVSSFLGVLPLLFEGKYEEASKAVCSFLYQCIGIHDYARAKGQSESFYHGVLVGLFFDPSSRYIVFSNKESGLGYSDIVAIDTKTNQGLIIECKYASKGDLKAGVEEALAQIDEKQYEKYHENRYKKSYPAEKKYLCQNGFFYCCCFYIHFFQIFLSNNT